MATTRPDPVRTFSIGGILARAWRMTRRDFFPLFGLLLTLYLPLVLVVILAVVWMQSSFAVPGHARSGGVHWDAVALVFGMMALFMVAGLIAMAAVTHAVFQRMKGETLSIGTALGAGLRRVPPLFLVNLVAGSLILVGFVLLIVPGIIAMTWFAMAFPVVILERPGAFGLRALGRSIELTKGHAWDIFALFLLVMFISYGVSMILQFTIILPAMNHPALAVVGFAVSFLLQFVIQIFTLICLVMAYHDLRVLKEGVSTSEIAAVFE